MKTSIWSYLSQSWLTLTAIALISMAVAGVASANERRLGDASGDAQQSQLDIAGVLAKNDDYWITHTVEFGDKLPDLKQVDGVVYVNFYAPGAAQPRYEAHVFVRPVLPDSEFEREDDGTMKRCPPFVPDPIGENEACNGVDAGPVYVKWGAHSVRLKYRRRDLRSVISSEGRYRLRVKSIYFDPALNAGRVGASLGCCKDYAPDQEPKTHKLGGCPRTKEGASC